MRYCQLLILCGLLAILCGILANAHYNDPEAVRRREEAETNRIEGLLAALPDPADVPAKVPNSLARVLESAAEIKVFSLDPCYQSEPLRDGSKFVLGSVVVKDPVTLKRVRDAIYRSIAEGDGRGDCFEPHHAIEAHVGEVVLSLRICFHCGSAGGEIRHTNKGGEIAIGKFAKPVLNEVLSAGGVRLAQN
ncbi:MAG TPA: hypothetical protein VHR72_11010 [Gemmataceae bacterium]|jgi:hypothetical protein|nr:hypothetical protein [Gemmataceae bacterium]